MATINPDWLPESSAKWRLYEQKALEIRRFMGIGLYERLDPYKLAALLSLKIAPLSSLEGLSKQAKEQLANSGQWSGAVTNPLPDGSRIIIINDSQSPKRQVATLMEEICHSLLGHTPSKIDQSNLGGRTYNRAVEEEAYAVGAAALVPYRSLSDHLVQGRKVPQIADTFGVSKALVEYRMKVLKLWRLPH